MTQAMEVRRDASKAQSLPALCGAILGLAAVATVVASGIGTRSGWWHFLVGLQMAEWAMWAAALALLASLVGTAQARPHAHRRGLALAVVGMVTALPLLAMAIQWEVAARMYPPINDISTDTTDAPVFWDMPDPTDYPGARVAELQRAAYPDLAPLKLALPQALAFEQALAVARAQGWEIVAGVPEEGRLEATVKSRLYGFTDEIAVRVKASGDGSQIDVRSRSRVGRIDRGVNAKRIRTYLAALDRRSAKATAP